MPDLPFTTFGIVRTRDLVQAVRGIRYSTYVKSTNFAEPFQITQILQPDTRRIRYEIYFAETSNTGPMYVDIFDTPNRFATGARQLLVAIPAGGQIVIARDWLEDGDAVCAPLWCINDAALDTGAAVSNVSVRETFLTPNPVDEPVV